METRIAAREKAHCACAKICLLHSRRKFGNLQDLVVPVNASAEVKLNNEHTIYCFISDAILIVKAGMTKKGSVIWILYIVLEVDCEGYQQ